VVTARDVVALERGVLGYLDQLVLMFIISSVGLTHNVGNNGFTFASLEIFSRGGADFDVLLASRQVLAPDAVVGVLDQLGFDESVALCRIDEALDVGVGSRFQVGNLGNLRDRSWHSVHGDGRMSHAFGDGCPQRVIERRRHRFHVVAGIVGEVRGREERSTKLKGRKCEVATVVFDLHFLCAQHCLPFLENYVSC
jgi:hypothetical protein